MEWPFFFARYGNSILICRWLLAIGIDRLLQLFIDAVMTLHHCWQAVIGHSSSANFFVHPLRAPFYLLGIPD